MFPDEGSIRWFAQGNDPQPWVNDKQELVLTQDKKITWITQKSFGRNNTQHLHQNGHHHGSQAWIKPVKVKENVKRRKQKSSLTFLPTWVFTVSSKKTRKNQRVTGRSQATEPYFWGGTWLGVYKDSKKTKLAYDFVKMMTQDEAFLTDWAKETGDVLAYKPVTEKIKTDFKDEFSADRTTMSSSLIKQIRSHQGSSRSMTNSSIHCTVHRSWNTSKVKKSKTKHLLIYKKVKNAYPDVKYRNKGE